MAKDWAATTTGAAAFKPDPLRECPGRCRRRSCCGLSPSERASSKTVIRVIGSLAGGPTAVAARQGDRLHHGGRRDRAEPSREEVGTHPLAVLLGGIGTLSLVIDPISWLAAGNSLGDVFPQADLLFVFVAPIRAVHLAAVIAALVLMFLPAANDYFRAAGKRMRM